MSNQIDQEKVFEYLADMIVLDHVEDSEKTSDIIKNEIIKSLKEDVKAINFVLFFMESIKENGSILTYDNENEKVYYITNQEVKSFLDKLDKAYKILLQMLEDNIKEFENMEI